MAKNRCCMPACDGCLMWGVNDYYMPAYYPQRDGSAICPHCDKTWIYVGKRYFDNCCWKKPDCPHCFDGNAICNVQQYEGKSNSCHDCTECNSRFPDYDDCGCCNNMDCNYKSWGWGWTGQLEQRLCAVEWAKIHCAHCDY